MKNDILFFNLPYWQPSSQSNQGESSHSPRQQSQHEPVACHHRGNGSVNKKSTLCTKFTLKLHSCYEVVFCDSASSNSKLFLRNIEFCYKVVTSGITNTYMYSLHTVWNSLSLSGNEIHS